MSNLLIILLVVAILFIPINFITGLFGYLIGKIILVLCILFIVSVVINFLRARS